MPSHVLGGFHHRLGKRRVGVDGPGDRFAGRFELECGARFSDQLSRFRTDDVDAEELVVFLVGDELHQAVRVAENLRF